MKKQANQGYKERSLWGLIVFRFSKNKLAMFGLGVIVLMVLTTIIAPMFMDYEMVYKMDMRSRFLKPGTNGHVFGTDQYGRDLLTRMIYGGRISLLSGFVTVGLSAVVGVILGSCAGYFGGRVDNIIMRFCDIFIAIPHMLMSMAVVAALGQGMFNMLIALSVSSFASYARTVRASILSIRNQEFIEAAKCCGVSPASIIFKHILPNCIGPVIVSATLGLGRTILSISSLGFLGIGIEPPTPEWGTILAESRASIRYYPYLGLVPGIFIVVTVMCLNFVGDGLRDALDPRTKS